MSWLVNGSEMGYLSSSGSQLSIEEEDVSWNGVMRLVTLSVVSTIGTMGSIFIISAVTVVQPLQVRGNIFLVNLALANLLVPTLVLPASVLSILARIPHDSGPGGGGGVCTFQWHTFLVTFHVSILSFMFMALENYLGLGSLVTYSLCCGSKTRILLVLLFIWLASLAFSLGQHFMAFGPTFCHNNNIQVWFPYHIAMSSSLILFPLLVTIWYFTASVFRLKSFKVQVETLEAEAETAYVLTDELLLKSNIFVFVVLLVMWVPGGVVATINLLQPVARNLIDTSWSLALANSCFYSYVYAATNRDFRTAFNKLFYYCCCKSHVTFSRRQQQPSRARPCCTNGDNNIGLRVHIIPGLNIYAQRKDNTSANRGNMSDL